MTNEYTDLVVGFGENLDAYAKWDAKVPTYLKQKLQPRQTAADEIHVYAKPGSSTRRTSPTAADSIHPRRRKKSAAMGNATRGRSPRRSCPHRDSSTN